MAFVHDCSGQKQALANADFYKLKELCGENFEAVAKIVDESQTRIFLLGWNGALDMIEEKVTSVRGAPE